MKSRTKFKLTEIGLIPEDWEVEKVNNLIIQRILDKPLDGNHGNIHPKNDDFVKKGVPFIMANNLKNNYIDIYNCKFIRKEQAEKLQKGFSKEGDVLLSHKATIGRVAIVQKSNYEYIILTPQVTYYRILNKNKLNNVFLKYYFISKIFQDLFMTWAGSGSTRAYLGITEQRNLPILIPPLQEQSAITKILSDLDSKVELLQKQNETLEKIGQAIFKHWFVDFEFPNEEGNPYKSSGGKMVESELGEIPEGWSVGKLGDLILKNRKPIKDYENWKDKDLIDLSNMPQFSMSITTFDKGEKFKSNIFELDEMDILFGSIRPYFGKYGFSPIKGAITGTVYSLKPKKEDYYAFILNIICRREFVDYTVRLSKGTKMPIIGWNDFSDFDVIANKEIITKFNNIIYPSILKIKTNILQILNLQKTRDLLLPKLMTGKIRVPFEVEE